MNLCLVDGCSIGWNCGQCFNRIIAELRNARRENVVVVQISNREPSQCENITELWQSRTVNVTRRRPPFLLRPPPSFPSMSLWLDRLTYLPKSNRKIPENHHKIPLRESIFSPHFTFLFPDRINRRNTLSKIPITSLSATRSGLPNPRSHTRYQSVMMIRYEKIR